MIGCWTSGALLMQALTSNSFAVLFTFATASGIFVPCYTSLRRDASTLISWLMTST